MVMRPTWCTQAPCAGGRLTSAPCCCWAWRSAAWPPRTPPRPRPSPPSGWSCRRSPARRPGTWAGRESRVWWRWLRSPCWDNLCLCYCSHVGHSPEVCDEGDELDREGGRGVHDVGVAGGVEGPVVGIVQVGQLPALAWQHRVGGQAGDLRGLAQHDVADVEYDGVLGHLLEYPTLVEEGPDQPVVLIVLLVPGPVLGPLTPRLVDLVRLVVVVDDPPGGLDVLLRVHLLQLVPSRTLEVSGWGHRRQMAGAQHSVGGHVSKKKGSDWLTVPHQRVNLILSC